MNLRQGSEVRGRTQEARGRMPWNPWIARVGWNDMSHLILEGEPCGNVAQVWGSPQSFGQGWGDFGFKSSCAIMLLQPYLCLFKLTRLHPPSCSHSGSCEQEQLEKAHAYLNKAQRVERVGTSITEDVVTSVVDLRRWLLRTWRSPSSRLSWLADACWHADSVNVPVHIVDFWCLSCGSGDANEFPGANTRVKHRIQEMWN